MGADVVAAIEVHQSSHINARKTGEHAPRCARLKLLAGGGVWATVLTGAGGSKGAPAGPAASLLMVGPVVGPVVAQHYCRNHASIPGCTP